MSHIPNKIKETTLQMRYWLASEIVPPGQYMGQSMDVGATLYHISHPTPVTTFTAAPGTWLISIPWDYKWPERPVVPKQIGMFEMIDLALDGWVCECYMHDDPKFVANIIKTYTGGDGRPAIVCWDRRDGRERHFEVNEANRAATYSVVNPQPKSSPKAGHPLPAVAFTEIGQDEPTTCGNTETEPEPPQTRDIYGTPIQDKPDDQKIIVVDDPKSVNEWWDNSVKKRGQKVPEPSVPGPEPETEPGEAPEYTAWIDGLSVAQLKKELRERVEMVRELRVYRDALLNQLAEGTQSKPEAPEFETVAPEGQKVQHAVWNADPVDSATAEELLRAETIMDAIFEERKRQIEFEGWSVKHDDKHDKGELGDYAAYYAMVPITEDLPKGFTPEHRRATQAALNPFAAEWAKKNRKPRLRQLTVAGALIVAEMGRLMRKDLKQAGFDAKG